MTRLRLALALATSLLLPLAAHASLARAASFDDKVDNAAQIVVGKCVRQHAEWDAAHRWILTYSTFTVEKTLKGMPVSEVTVVIPGGAVGDIHQDTVGMPAFREGQENVVFVRNTRVGPTVLYFEQGAYDVLTDAKGNRVVQPVASDAVHIDTQRGVAVAAEAPRTLQQFESDVRASMLRQAKQRMELIRGTQKRADADSLSRILQRNKLLVGLALAGIFLAGWQFFKR
jgi:hypothetical protein